MVTNEFLSAVFELIKLNYPVGSPDGMSAARVGMLIRQAFPQVSWESIGFPKLKHILSSLEARGWIKTGQNSKFALSIWLTEPIRESQTAIPSPRHNHRQFLRKDVWNAFVLEFPRGRRFLNRRNGAVRLAAIDAPDASDDWVEFEPIQQQLQRTWSEGFLDSHQLLSTPPFSTLLNSAEWYRGLRDELLRRDPTLVGAWNRARTEKVVEYVNQWCANNGVPQELLFERSRFAQAQTEKAVPSSAINLREALIEAVGRMSLEELLEIRIPAKYLVEQLLPGGIRENNSIREAGR